MLDIVHYEFSKCLNSKQEIIDKLNKRIAELEAERDALRKQTIDESQKLEAERQLPANGVCREQSRMGEMQVWKTIFLPFHRFYDVNEVDIKISKLEAERDAAIIERDMLLDEKQRLIDDNERLKAELVEIHQSHREACKQEE